MIVTVPAGEYVDLYDATGISATAQLRVISVSDSTMFLFSTANEPTFADDKFPVRFGASMVNQIIDPGAWVFAPLGGGLSVTEV